MKIALIGMPQVGKKTLFSLMTGMPYDQLTSRATEYAVGMVKVTDSGSTDCRGCINRRRRNTPRLNARSRQHHPRTRSHATNGSAN